MAGSIWEASGTHLGSIWGDIWRNLENLELSLELDLDLNLELDLDLELELDLGVIFNDFHRF